MMCTQTESEQEALQERMQAIQTQQEELRDIKRVAEPQARYEHADHLLWDQLIVKYLSPCIVDACLFTYTLDKELEQ